MSLYRGYFVPGAVDPLGLKKWKTKVVAKSFIADISKHGTGFLPTIVNVPVTSMGGSLPVPYPSGTGTWGHPQTGSYLAQFEAVFFGTFFASSANRC